MDRTFLRTWFVKFCCFVITNCRKNFLANFKGLKESKADFTFLLKSQSQV